MLFSFYLFFLCFSLFIGGVDFSETIFYFCSNAISSNFLTFL